MKRISKVGIGTYRMTIEKKDHYESLLHAVKSGYNLIDTATNYQNGGAEKLIGKLIVENPQIRDEIFVVSKAGYLPSNKNKTNDLKLFLDKENIEKAIIDEDFEYSLDPLFLNFQLTQSLERIQSDYIDCYLLHNPERYLQSFNLNNNKTLYKSIERSFEFLEEKVSEGKIKFYGISSNNLFFPYRKKSIDLEKIIGIAEAINKKHHFKFIQFPFNFKEEDALIKSFKNNKSLLDIIKDKNLIAIGNRPLNMNENGMEFRLVSYKNKLWEINEVELENQIAYFLDLITKRIDKIYRGKVKMDDFEPIFILKNYKKFSSIETFDSFFNQNFVPFIKLLYKESYEEEIKPLSFKIKQGIDKIILKGNTVKTNNFINELVKKGVKEKENTLLTACNYYINDVNLNHVLVGLRKKIYVDDLMEKFTI